MRDVNPNRKSLSITYPIWINKVSLGRGDETKKPHLGGIQEFRVAAYVKDMSAGKFDARAQIG